MSDPESTAVREARVMNNAEAQRALDEARRFLDLGELERAYRLARRAQVLAPSPAGAAAVQNAMQRMQANPRYCGRCYRFKGNCVCEATRAPALAAAGVREALPLDALRLLSATCSRIALWAYQRLLLISLGLQRYGIHPSYSFPLAVLLVAISVVGAARLLANSAAPHAQRHRPHVMRPGHTFSSSAWLPGDLSYSYMSPSGSTFFVGAPLASSVLLSVLVTLAMRGCACRVR